MGVKVRNGLVQSTGTGLVTVKGKDGTGGGYQYGVYVHGGGDIVGGTTGTYTIDGMGGGVYSYGVFVEGSGATIRSSSGGDVKVICWATSIAPIRTI